MFEDEMVIYRKALADTYAKLEDLTSVESQVYNKEVEGVKYSLLAMLESMVGHKFTVEDLTDILAVAITNYVHTHEAYKEAKNNV